MDKKKKETEISLPGDHMPTEREILTGFIAFITKQKTPITASKRHDKTLWLKKVDEYLEGKECSL